MMVTPNISEKTASTNTLSQKAKDLFRLVYEKKEKKDAKDKFGDDTEQKIKVSDVISKMSFYYEKIRNYVDYNEDHLLRKEAIKRIFKRQIMVGNVIQELKCDEISRHLLVELIRAAYLPNNKIPETKIQEIGKVIDRYLKLRSLIAKNKNIDLEERKKIVTWIMAVAATEIEGRLGSDQIRQAVGEYMFDTISKSVIFPDNEKVKKDKEIQIFLSINRKFMNFDEEMLGFILLKYYVAGWVDASDALVEKTAEELPVIFKAADAQLHHPLAKRLDRITSRYNIFFSVLLEAIESDPAGVYYNLKYDPKAFPRTIKKICEEKYRKTKDKLWRAGIRSIIYLFLTKMIVVLILEMPVSSLMGEAINYVSLAINVSFPPALLFLSIFLTSIPSEDNTKKIIEGIEGVIFEGKEKLGVFKLTMPVKRSLFSKIISTSLYLVTYVLSFGGVIWALDKIHFNVVSIIIFIFFLTLVSFFSLRVRKGVRDLMVTESRESFTGLLSDFFYTPIIAVGKMLSENFSKINVFVFILDFIIEAPFKFFVDIAEQWAKYVRERREDLE